MLSLDDWTDFDNEEDLYNAIRKEFDIWDPDAGGASGGALERKPPNTEYFTHYDPTQKLEVRMLLQTPVQKELKAALVKKISDTIKSKDSDMIARVIYYYIILSGKIGSKKKYYLERRIILLIMFIA